MQTRFFSVLLISTIFSACATPEYRYDPYRDAGLMWVKHAAEYQAVASQAYAAASSDLERLVADRNWTAMPDQPVDPALPPGSYSGYRPNRRQQCRFPAVV